ncbi:MAG: DUF1640 domain-containing protein [Alphaproteobacteria bacterium]|nr:DUF1640 domain-containing protein [Alphaproteobacteria bacterium]
MSNVAFDTLKLAKRLEEVGFAPNQAAATSSAIADAMSDLIANLATKTDIVLLRRDMAEIELRMTVKLGAMLAAAVGITAGLVKLL